VRSGKRREVGVGKGGGEGVGEEDRLLVLVKMIFLV